MSASEAEHASMTALVEARPILAVFYNVSRPPRSPDYWPPKWMMCKTYIHNVGTCRMKPGKRASQREK